METVRLRKKYFLACLAYGLLVTAALLYLRFPAEALKGQLERRAGAGLYGLSLTIRELQLAFPPGLRLRGAALGEPGSQAGAPVFLAEETVIRPQLLPLLFGERACTHVTRAYGGEIRGETRFAGGRFGGPFSLRAEIEGLRVGAGALLADLLPAVSGGAARGSLDYQGSLGQLSLGRGTAELRIGEGRLALPPLVFGLESLEFREILLRLTLENRQLRLEGCRILGKAFEGELSGTLLLEPAIGRSRLELRGELVPYPALLASRAGSVAGVELLRSMLRKGRLVVLIQGSLSDPVFKVL